MLEECYKNNKSVFLEEGAKNFVKNLKDCEHNVSHEITHWIDDSITNFIKPKFYNIKKIAQINEIDFDKLMTSPNIVINSQYFEINAQMHAIKTIREKYLYEWDKYTIYDVISKNTSLEAVYKILAFYSLKYANNWIKHLLKRMYREKLLGEKMQENKSIGFSEYIRKYINEDYEISYFEIKRDDKFHELLKP